MRHGERVPELHGLRAKHDFVRGKKLLQLHFHMIGHDSIEEAIFLRYLAHVREHHPTATVPGIFADEKLFNDARTLLAELGDEAFFGPMSQGATGAGEWGAFGGGTTWDRARFEHHATSMTPRRARSCSRRW